MRAVLALILTAALAACAPAATDEQAAIGEFYEAYNAEDYDTLWEGMHSLVREKVDRDDFIEVIEASRAVLGQYRSAEEQSTKSLTFDSLEFKETLLKTTFDSEVADVTFRSAQDGDRVRLTSFNVDSIKAYDEYIRRQREAQEAAVSTAIDAAEAAAAAADAAIEAADSANSRATEGDL